MAEAENQIRFRAFNEWILAANASIGSRRAMEQFICECSDGECREAILLTRDEYEWVRAGGSQFALALNHENPALERVISENDRFATSLEVPGPAQRRALASDPRI